MTAATKTLKAVASIGYVLIVLSSALFVFTLLVGCNTGSCVSLLPPEEYPEIKLPEDHGTAQVLIRYPHNPNLYSCTGVLTAGEQGVIYTARHCVHNATSPASDIRVCIGAPTSECYDADIVLLSDISDQALIHIADVTPEVIDTLEEVLGFGATICPADDYIYGDFTLGTHHKGSHIVPSYGMTHDETAYLQSGNMDHGSSGGPIWSLTMGCLYGVHNGDGAGDWERFAVPSIDPKFESIFRERCPAAFN